MAIKIMQITTREATVSNTTLGIMYLRANVHNAMIQNDATDTIMYLSVIRKGWWMVNLIATSLSKVTSIRWNNELVIPAKRTRLWKFRRIFWATLFLSNSLNSSTRMLDGCAVRPMKASVAAKHASKMLALLWRRGRCFPWSLRVKSSEAMALSLSIGLPEF